MQTRNRLLVMSWAHQLNDGAANYLPGVLPVILVTLGASKPQAGILMGVLLVGQGLQPLIGWFSDKVGGKSVALVGLYGSTICGALLGLVGYYWIMVPLLVVMGLLNSCFHPQAMGAVRYITTERRGLSTSVFLVGGEAGRGVWPMLAALIVAGLGIRYLWLLALPAIASLPLLLAAFPSLPAKPRTTKPIAWSKHCKPLTSVVLFTTLRITIVFLLITYLPQHWKQIGGGVVGGGALITTLYIAGLLGNGLGGHLADRLGFRTIALLASAVTVVLMGGLMLVSGWAYWIVLALLGISIFATVPISVTLAQDVLPENPSMGAGIALGFCNALAAVALMVLSPLAGVIDFQGMLWLAAALSIPAAAAAWFLPKGHHASHTGGTDASEFSAPLTAAE